jgi:hypothetical protein
MIIAVRRAVLLSIFGIPAAFLTLFGILFLLPVMNLMDLLIKGRATFVLREALEPGLEIFSTCWNIKR